MKPKLILCLALVLSGGLFGCSRVEIPSIEYTQNYFSGQSASNLWSGRTFSKILPAQEIKHIILFDDRAFQNPFLPRTTPQEIQIQCNALFSYLEHSAQKTGGSYLADNEGTGAQFVIVTSSGGVFHVQALSRFGVGILGNTTGVLISGQGLAARIDLKDFPSSSVTNPPAVDTDPPLPPVETDYLLDQKPGDWAGRRFEQIVPVRKIKRIVLLEETTDILDYFPKEPNAPEQREHQIGYGKLFDQFEASGEMAKAISMSKDEAPFARLLLFTSSDQVIYLEIIGTQGRIERGAVVGNHIAGVLIHEPGKGVRINLNIPPVSLAK